MYNDSIIVLFCPLNPNSHSVVPREPAGTCAPSGLHRRKRSPELRESDVLTMDSKPACLLLVRKVLLCPRLLVIRTSLRGY